jgi:putative proteasome-type protease
MTYCVALKMNDGMVFASDSRTNAGVDQVGCFKKMRTYSKEGERQIVTMSSGNLSITQSAINLLEQRATDDNVPNIWNAQTMFEIATLIGESLREVRKEAQSSLGQTNVDLGANFIIGGQIKGEAPRLFLIGETKYGKPVLDRFIGAETHLSNAIKCVLVSFDSTMRSNISVGLPIDLVTVPKDALSFGVQYHITEDDEYFSKISSLWRDGLGSLFEGLPEPKIEQVVKKSPSATLHSAPVQIRQKVDSH